MSLAQSARANRTTRPRAKGTRRDTVRLRRLTSADARPAAELFRKVVQDLAYYTPQARKSEIAKYSARELHLLVRAEPESVVVAEAGGRIAGLCLSRFDDGLIWLAWFVVDPAARGAGIGSRLLARLEETAARRGAHKIWCDCRVANLISQQALLKSGFVPFTCVRDHWYGEDFLLFEKHVASVRRAQRQRKGNRRRSGRKRARSFASAAESSSRP